MISAVSSYPTFFSSPYGLRGEGNVAPFEQDKTAKNAAVSGEKPDAEEGGLTAEEERAIAELKKTDAKVRQHEAAHMAAGGSLVTSGASFTYETGPDGARYAVGGEVGIDVSKSATPEETAQKARRIRAAALAPADPSAQDRSVASMASQMEMQAMQEIAQQRMEAARGGGAQGKETENAGEAHLGTKRGGLPENVRAQAISAYQSVAGQETRLPGNLMGRSGGISAYA